LAVTASMDRVNRFYYLLHLYREGTISAAEQDELFALITTRQHDNILKEQVEQDLKNGFNGPKANLPPHISQEIIRNILSAEKKTSEIIPIKKPFRIWRWVAAASVLIIGFTSYFLMNRNEKNTVARMAPVHSYTIRNVTDTTQLILLSDGSRVSLESNSTFYYPPEFSDTTRDVYLEGKAFFEVTHNPQKPFLVHSTHIVTKVLGTSFFIDTHTLAGNEEVSVRTGRVQVSENINTGMNRRLESVVIISPNQKAIYETEKRLFVTTLVEKPQPIVNEKNFRDSLAGTPLPGFNYDQEKLEHIFNQLENTYGVEIIPENPNLENCLFTGDLSGEDLFTKLKILCLATQSSYEINGTRILMKGRGCE